MFFLVSRLNSLDKKLRISPHVYSFPFPPSFFSQKHYVISTNLSKKIHGIHSKDLNYNFIYPFKLL